MIVSIVGAYDREAIQAFVNALLNKGGITEFRLLQMGTAEYLTTLVTELKIVNDFDEVFPVDMKDLVIRNGVTSEVVVFMNSSFKPFLEFVTSVSHLLEFIADEIQKAGVEETKFLFGDNYRGIAQQRILTQHLLKSELDIKGFKFTTVSSVFEISKILNSSIEDEKFRCYPKIDGTGCIFDPSGKMTQDSTKALSVELEKKIESIETMFCNRSSSSYPNIEGTVLARFMILYIQFNDWDLAMRDSALISRHPFEEEIKLYGLECDVVLFLPPLAHNEDNESDDNEENRSHIVKLLPKPVFKHIKDASDFVDNLVL